MTQLFDRPRHPYTRGSAREPAVVDHAARAAGTRARLQGHPGQRVDPSLSSAGLLLRSALLALLFQPAGPPCRVSSRFRRSMALAVFAGRTLMADGALSKFKT